MITGVRTYPIPGNSIQGGGSSPGLFSQSIQGGGQYGTQNTQSIQGGGSVSGTSLALSSNGTGTQRSTIIGVFFKVATLPASDMTLVDLSAGVNGYFRIKLTSGGRVFGEGSFNSVTHSLQANPVTAVTTGVWNYVSAVYGSSPFSNNQCNMDIQVTGPGSASDGAKESQSAPAATNGLFVATLGWGISQSSSYLNFPNTSGNEMSKLQGKHGVSNATVSLLFSPPGSDPSATGMDYLYLCRDGIGIVSGTLTDSSSNAVNMTPGVSGMTVVVDGPYA